MKRSEINQLIRDASAAFERGGWTLPPEPRWDVTDFGLGDWRRYGLVLVNLAEEPEYCEKLMYAKRRMTTPAHCHKDKTEDIIARSGVLRVQLWAAPPGPAEDETVHVKVNGEPRELQTGATIDLQPGWRIKLHPEVYHEFAPLTGECIIGEVSSMNDDAHDNFFVDPDVGRFPEIDEDEGAIVRLLSDR